MGREGDWADKNVDLKQLFDEVSRFFQEDGFHEILTDSDPHGTWFEIRAKKTGVLRTIVSSRKAIHVIIKGSPNKFRVFVGTGEWGKNLILAELISGPIGLVGMLLTLRFTGKLWDHIKKSIEYMENSYTKPTVSEGNADFKP